MVAAMPAGSLVGALAVSWFGENLGRRKTIALSGFIWVVGSLLQCAAQVITINYSIIWHATYCKALLSFRAVVCWSWAVSLEVSVSVSPVLQCTLYLVSMSLLRSDVSLPQTHVPGRNHCASHSWSIDIIAAVEHYVGYSYPVFYTIRLLVHQWSCIVPNSMGSSDDSWTHSWIWHALFPGIPSLVDGEVPFSCVV